MSDDNRPDIYGPAYRRVLLSMLSALLLEDRQPDLDMDEAAAKEWFRPIPWLALKSQSYADQAMDHLEVMVMAERDAWVALLRAFHTLLFNTRDSNVELGPTFVLDRDGKAAFHVKTYEDAEPVRKARDVKQQEQTK